MLSYLDCLILFILGGLFVNPRRYSSVYRAAIAAFAAGLLTAAVYLLVTRVLLGPMAELGAALAGVFA
jgi:hypothetical protein